MVMVGRDLMLANGEDGGNLRKYDGLGGRAVTDLLQVVG